MIARNETVLPYLNDEYLLQYRTRGEGQRAYADALLTAPPEYRHGILVRENELTTAHRINDSGSIIVESTGDQNVGRRQALAELAEQGVQLRQPPAGP